MLTAKFETKEVIAQKYWSDPLWEEVDKLRKEGKILEANNIIFHISRKHYR